MDTAAFYIFAAIIAASALVVGQRNPMHSVMLLITSFGALAGLAIRVVRRPAARPIATDMADQKGNAHAGTAGVPGRGAAIRDWLETMFLWRIWERLLEIEFVDRSVALAGKAFVSFFPLVIVVAAFVPPSTRSSIFTTLTHRLGSAVKRWSPPGKPSRPRTTSAKATGSSGSCSRSSSRAPFTTALQRSLRALAAAARSEDRCVQHGAAWLLVILASMAVLGAFARLLGIGPVQLRRCSRSCRLGDNGRVWWFTALGFLLLGDVRRARVAPDRRRSLAFSSALRALRDRVDAELVTRNEDQFGFFGVALALVTWFSGAAICLLIGACADPSSPKARGVSVGSSAATRIASSSPVPHSHFHLLGASLACATRLQNG